MNRIVFITPYFGNTGSEIALFNLIVRIKGFEVIVISRQKGSLASQLPSDIQFYDYQSFYKTNKNKFWLVRLRNKLLRLRATNMDYFLQSVIGSRKALFYVNTLVMPEVIRYLKRKRYKFILHSHELQQRLISLQHSDILNIVDNADFIFASSNASKDVLTKLGRNKDIAISYPGIDIKKIRPLRTTAEIRKKLNIKADEFVIAMSGTIDSNKNPEEFLAIGKKLKDKGYPVHLLWIGVDTDNGYYYFLKGKVKEYGMEMNCTWVYKLDGETYYEYLNISDCFVLTSRYESFSIVLVEALALGKPVFSFYSGGPQEIINDLAIGRLIEDHSCQQMTEEIEKLIKGQITFNVEMAQARASHFSVEEIFEKWFKTIKERYLNT